MKKKILSGLTALFLVCIVMFTLAACNENEPSHTHSFETLKYDNEDHWFECACGDKSGIEKHIPNAEVTNQKCAVCDFVMSDSTTDEENTLIHPEITFATLTVNGEEVSGKVSNDTEQYNFNNELTVPEGSIAVIVPLNSNISNGVANKIIDLQVGDNACIIYLMVGNDVKKTYNVTIRRLPMYTVNFVTGNGETITSQTIEECSNAVQPNDLERVGYTFNGWNFDFSTPITSNVTVSASWSANTNTPYVVEYYLENLEDDNYTLTESVNNVGITDTLAYAEIKTYIGFTADGNIVSGNINGDGKQILKVYYQRNEYYVTSSNTGYGNITGTGTYKYGTPLTLIAIQPNWGYEFLGWYNGETLLSNNLEYVVIIDKNIEAKFDIVPELQNFTFIYTGNACTITGIRDKTVTEIVIPDCVTSIGDSAFRYLTRLTSVTIPDCVTNIGDYAFYDCDSLTNVTIGDGVTSIGSLVFAGCTSLTSVTIGDSVPSIKGGMFYDCTSLTSVIIPDSVKSIGANAFYHCTSLTSVTIGNGVTDIYYDAFVHCNNLTNVYINDIKAWCNISGLRNLMVFASNNMNLYLDNELITELIIPDCVTSICDYAFYNCSGLTSIIIPDSVTSIGDCAFCNCTSLTLVRLLQP